ncbi:MAG: hypothetical protein ACUVRN_10230 [Candidatus Caldatribacteriaceae bacterium]
MKRETWDAFRSLIKYISEILKLSSPPMPILGDEYYSTGSFSYFRDLGFRLRKEYYFVVADFMDSPIFWPLVAHEVGHCWLNETKYIQEISTLPEALEIETKTKVSVEKRIEETLCDLVGVRLFGPAYVHSYNLKLWLRFPKPVHEDYPQHPFRLKCMLDMLYRLEMDDAAENIREICGERFDADWQKEEISPLKDHLLEASENFPKTISRRLYEESLFLTEQLYSSPPRNPVLLFSTCWNRFLKEDPEKVVNLLPRFSSIILKALAF